MSVAPTSERLLAAALTVLGERGARDLTVRAVEDAAGVPHGSIRHHFGDRRGLLLAIFDHLERSEAGALDDASGGAPAPPPESATDTATAAPAPSAEAVSAIVDGIEAWLSPGRTQVLARYELFLLAARDPELRVPLVRARERFVARAAQLVGPDHAAATVAAIDGLVLDGLVRGAYDRAALTRAVTRILGGG